MNATRPLHAPMEQFAVLDGCLTVGGIPITRLAERVGTPFFAYDRHLLTRRVAHLREHLPEDIHLHYAIKANPMPALVQHMVPLVEGLDVASGGELNVALDAGADPRHISFAGPGKRVAELRAALSAGITVNLESFTELERLAALGEQTGLRPRVAVRVNPDFELKASGMKMGGGPKPFGVDAEQVPEMLERIKVLELDFQGFHIFSGSQNLRPEAIVEAQTKSLEMAFRLAEKAPGPLSFVNIGGGFGIPYFPGDKPLDLEPVGENLARLQPVAAERLGDAAIVIELGRYLVGEAGIYVAEIIDRKVSRGHTFLVTNGGLHHHLAASGNFGQVIRKNYPVAIGNRMNTEERETVTVVGPLCTPLDLLAERMELGKADIGDLVVVFQSGAYGISASPQYFLSHPAPAEVLV